MQIEHPEAIAEVEGFSARIRTRLAEHGRLAGIAEGEAFKAIGEV
jgi:hypothetical protein